MPEYQNPFTPEIQSLIGDLDGGLPSSINVLCAAVLSFDAQDEALAFLQKVRDSGTRGSAIWTTYKDDCAEDMERFKQQFLTD